MRRIPELDGLRGIAIVLILAWHYLRCQIVAQPNTLLAYGGDALNLTWSGVDLFFVLSGFLIAGVLLDHRDSSNYFRVFYLRRVCRIVPLYALMLGLYIGFTNTSLSAHPSYAWSFRNPLPLWSYATFTQNIVMGIRGDYGPNWLGITWSLAIEEQFYILVPLLIYGVPRRWLVYVLLILASSAPVLRWVSPGFHAFVNTPWRWDAILTGALLAALLRFEAFRVAIENKRPVLRVLFIIFLVSGAIMTLDPNLFGHFNHVWLEALYGTLLLLTVTSAKSRLTTLLTSPVLTWFGQRSYGIYLFHQAIAGLAHATLLQQSPYIRSIQDAGITGLALLITLVLSDLSYRYFESPIIRFGYRFPYVPGPQKQETSAPILGGRAQSQREGP